MASLSVSGSIQAALVGLTAVLFVWVIILSLAVRRFSRASRRLGAALREDSDVVQLVAKSLDDIERLFGKCDQLASVDRKNRSILSTALTHVGVVRYDAFSDVGGRLSFSAALLTEKGDGIVISSINGREASRVYAKPVEERSSTYSLSQEEEQAIAQAVRKVTA
jgi:hypothetical protein